MAEFSRPDPSPLDCLWDECFISLLRVFTRGDVNWVIAVPVTLLLTLLLVLLYLRLRGSRT